LELFEFVLLTDGAGANEIPDGRPSAGDEEILLNLVEHFLHPFMPDAVGMGEHCRQAW
jgi:hypothetical protein